jgi:hypothetical protein
MQAHIKEIQREVVDWLYLSKNKDQQWPVINTIMKFSVPYKAENS